MSDGTFAYTPVLTAEHCDVEWRSLGAEGVRVVRHGLGDVLEVQPEALARLARAAYEDVSHLLRPSHLAQLRRIILDPEASPNDRYVAKELLANAAVSAGRVLPMCQDTGTAIVVAKRGHRVWTVGVVGQHPVQVRVGAQNVRQRHRVAVVALLSRH